MDNKLSFSGKGRMPKTTMMSPFIGASLCISLLLSTAQSFSITGNHIRNQNSINRHHPVNRDDGYHQQQRRQHHLPTIERISSGVALANKNTNDLPSGDVTDTRVGSTRLSAHRVGTTYLPYLNYDLEMDVPDIAHRRLELPSTEQNWEGPSGRNIAIGGSSSSSLSSPSTIIPLGFSFYVPNGVSASLFSTNRGRRIDSSSPLVLTPDRKDHNPSAGGEEASSSEFLHSFLRTNQKWILEQILDYGAVVFRGFADPVVAGSSSGSEIPAIGKEILRAFNPRSDTRNGFGCYVISEKRCGTEPHSSTGRYSSTLLGGTSTGSHPTTRISELSAQSRLTDWRGIHDDLPPKLRRKLTEKNLLYIRSHLVPPASSQILLPLQKISGSEITTVDDDGITEIVATGEKPSPWFQLFGSTNKKAFEKAYQQIVEPIVQQQLEKAAGMVEERFFVCEAFRCHPLTNEKIWFEHAHRFHWTSLPAEILSDFARTKNPWTLARAVGEASVSFWNRLLRGSRSFPQRKSETTTVTFGDGTPVSCWEMHQIRRAIRKNTAQHAWQTGDLLVVDGLSMGLK
jgi:hypothetical protein